MVGVESGKEGWAGAESKGLPEFTKMPVPTGTSKPVFWASAAVEGGERWH